MTNKIFDRQVIENDLDVKFTDEQWKKIDEELSVRVENFIDEILSSVVHDVLNLKGE